MNYFSADTESTGLDTQLCQPIEFSALYETPNDQKSFEDIPKFTRYIKWPHYIGEAYALQMNKHIFEILSALPGTEDKQHLVCNYDELTEHFCIFLDSIGFKREKGFYYLNIVGKNFAKFDAILLEKIPGWVENIKIRHRTGDPAILYLDWYNDRVFPNLSDCKKIAGLDEYVSHDSAKDAWDVIEVCRKKYGPKPEVIK